MANGKQLDFIPTNHLKPGEIVQGKDRDYNLSFYTQIAPSVQPGSYKDYNNLINKPQINGITLEGNITFEDLGLKEIYRDSTSNWNKQRDLIAEKACLYVYSDYDTIEVDGVTKEIPGLKIGDGTTYLIDLPFVSDKIEQVLLNHIDDNNIHITESERETWNNKVTAYESGGTLILEN